MKILTFGIVKEILGNTSVIVSDSNISVAALKAKLEEQYPRLKQLSSFMIAVNGEYANADTIIISGDEVAIIPPVSGG
jgi:molybdopterin synthase sulfur carrier subunit